MKVHKTITLLAFLAVCTIPAFAQDQKQPLNTNIANKPRQFSDLPERAPMKVSALENLLDLPVGATVNTNIADKVSLVGVVVSKSNPADATVKSIVVKSTNRKGAIFTFTRRTSPDGTFSFIGRMLNKDAGDALEIVKEGQDYVIRKKELSRIMSE